MTALIKKKLSMERRQAIQRIGVIAAGVALFPACQIEEPPVFNNLPISLEQWGPYGLAHQIHST